MSVSEVEENKKKALKLANSIYKAICEKKDSLKNIDHEVRMNFVRDRYPTFHKAYPVILRFMILEFMYTEEAFRFYLDEADIAHGKGMEEFIELQCRYVRKLHTTYYSKNKIRYNMPAINGIVSELRKNLYDYYVKVKKEEEELKSEYAEKNVQYDLDRRAEFIRFLNKHRDEYSEYTKDAEDIGEEFMELLEDDWDISKVNFTQDPEENAEILKELHKYQDDLLWLMNKQNRELEEMEKEINEKLEEETKKREEEFLQGTNLYNGKAKKNNRKERRKANLSGKNMQKI